MKFFLEYMKYLSIFGPNAGKYRPENTPYLDTFHVVCVPVLNLNMEFYIAYYLPANLFKFNIDIINLLKANVPFLRPLKISENFWFSGVCRWNIGSMKKFFLLCK